MKYIYIYINDKNDNKYIHLALPSYKSYVYVDTKAAMANDLSHRQAYQGANEKSGEIPRNPLDIHGISPKSMGSIGLLGFLEVFGIAWTRNTLENLG